jgi:hypothetical protein
MFLIPFPLKNSIILLLVRCHCPPIWPPALLKSSWKLSFEIPHYTYFMQSRVPNLMSIFHRLSNLSKESTQVQGSNCVVRSLFFMVRGLLAPHPTPCHWSAAVYSLYSQLASIAGGHPSIHNMWMFQAMVTRGTLLHHTQTKTNSMAISPRVNYTDWATATCRRNLVPTFVDKGVSGGQRGRSLTVVNLSYLDRLHHTHKKVKLLWYCHF